MKEIFDLILNKLKSLNIFSLVDRYKGEFDEGADWNPVFPACYIRLTGVQPEFIGSAGEVLKHRISFNLYIAEADREEPKVLELIDKVADIREIDNNPVFLNNINWAGYIKGVELYLIGLDVVF